MGLRGRTSDGIAGDGGKVDAFSKMGPGCEIWSHFAHSGLILILLAKMLKSPNEKNEGFCPTADPPLSHC